MDRVIIDVQTGEVRSVDYTKPDWSPSLIEWRKQASIPFVTMARALFAQGEITGQEAVAWAERGETPAAIITAAKGLALQDQQFTALVEANRNSVIGRNDILIEALRVAYGYTPEQLDQFFSLPG